MAEQPTTPQEWLPILTQRLDADRPRCRLLARYVDGDAPLPEMSQNVRQSWVRFQKMSRTNWGELIRDAVADRIVPNGIIVKGDAKSANAKAAQRIWRDNRMDAVFKEWLRYGLVFRSSFLTVWRDDDGKAVITADSPETMVVAEDPLQPWRVRAAARWYRDYDAEADYLHVWAQSSWQRFRRSVYTSPEDASPNAKRRKMWTRVSGNWEPIGDEGPTPYGWSDSPPVVVYRNPGGAGEYENHLDLVNRINSSVLQILAITAMQAFRQRGIKGGLLPEKDGEGNAIDWTKVFEAAPGALWNLPDGLDIWESTPTDIGPLLSELKDHIRHLSAVTRTPVSVLIPDAANQSAEGAQNTKEGLIFKCGDRMSEARVGAESVLVKALAVEGITLAAEDNVEVLFEPVAMVTLAEKYQAASQAKAAGESWRSIARNILGYSPDQIEQDALDRADEMLTQMATAQQFAAITGQQTPQRALPPGREDTGRQAMNEGRNGQPGGRQNGAVTAGGR